MHFEINGIIKNSIINCRYNLTKVCSKIIGTKSKKIRENVGTAEIEENAATQFSNISKISFLHSSNSDEVGLEEIQILGRM